VALSSLNLSVTGAYKMCLLYNHSDNTDNML